jgi:hypothetical protein
VTEVDGVLLVDIDLVLLAVDVTEDVAEDVAVAVPTADADRVLVAVAL